MSVHKHTQTTSQRQSNRWTEEDGEREQGRPNGPAPPLASPDFPFSSASSVPTICDLDVSKLKCFSAGVEVGPTGVTAPV